MVPRKERVGRDGGGFDTDVRSIFSVSSGESYKASAPRDVLESLQGCLNEDKVESSLTIPKSGYCVLYDKAGKIQGFVLINGHVASSGKL